MLQKLNGHSIACLEHASVAEERAAQTADATRKAEHLRVAQRWRHLAHSYQFVESLNYFLLDSRKAKAGVLRRAATCPFCRRQMHLVSGEPTRYTNISLLYYSCDCGLTTYQYVADCN